MTQVIVGDPVWAESRLGGVWVGSPSKDGIGWLLEDEQLVPPPAPEPEPDLMYPDDRSEVP